VRYVFGAYDVYADRLHGRLRAHKNAREVLAFYQQIRMRYGPRLRLYLIADNLSTHSDPAAQPAGPLVLKKSHGAARAGMPIWLAVIETAPAAG
jgi:hypothetical protein